MQIQPIAKNHHAELLSFLSTTGSGATESKKFWSQRLHHWWTSNPCINDDSPRGWILIDNEKIVGFLGNIPTLHYSSHNNKIFETRNLSTWRVKENARSNSLTLLMNCIQLSKNTIIFDTTPTPRVAKILSTLRFNNLGDTRLNYRIPVYLNFSTQIIRLLKSDLNKTKVGKYDCRLLDVIDDSFDELWERTKSYTTTIVRNSAWIEWFCWKNSFFAKLLFAIYKGNVLIGFGIFQKTCLKRKISTLYCVDLWIDSKYPDGIVALVNEVERYCKKNNIWCIAIKNADANLNRHLKKTMHFSMRKPTNYFFKWSLKNQTYDPHDSYYYVGGDFGV